MSKERIKLLKAYGATVVLTDGALGMKGAIDEAERIRKATPNSIIAGQFDNPANPLAHYLTTANEIWQDTDGKVDIFVAGIGSAGTISGTGKRLKELNPNVQIIGIEPQSSPLITKGESGSHKIQGIGANFIPNNYDQTAVDQVIAVSDQKAYEYANLMAKKQGILVGISSGAALSVAVELAHLPQNQNKVIVALMPDAGDRYLSTDLYGE
jgi:cysteine synthase A